jgi:hypothetical protein
MSTLQLKMAWLEGTRNRLEVFIEQGGNLESEEANCLSSAFLEAFGGLATDFVSRGGEPSRNLSNGLASKTTDAPATGAFQCGESEIRSTTNADPSTVFAAKYAANSARDDNSILARTSDSGH